MMKDYMYIQEHAQYMYNGLLSNSGKEKSSIKKMKKETQGFWAKQLSVGTGYKIREYGSIQLNYYFFLKKLAKENT